MIVELIAKYSLGKSGEILISDKIAKFAAAGIRLTFRVVADPKQL